MNSHPVLIVLLIAVAAPLLTEIPIGVRLPTVVLEMMLGVIIGPQVLGLATPEAGGAPGMAGWETQAGGIVLYGADGTRSRAGSGPPRRYCPELLELRPAH